jgi:hypothetical protein
MPEPFLFVCHVSEDRAAAMQIVEELERRGVRCWIAPRDVRPGRPFDDEIANAIDNSEALLLIFTDRCNDSEYIRREVTVAGESHKVIVPLRIENAEPKHGLRVRLSDLHWLDAFASREYAIEELVRIFPAKTGEVPAAAMAAVAATPPPAPAPEAKRSAEKEEPARLQPAAVRRPWPLSRLLLGAAACIILAAIGAGAYFAVTSFIKPTETKKQIKIAVQPAPPPRPPTFISATCKPGAASFYDDFHKEDRGWNFITGDVIHYADGQLVVTPHPNRSITPEYLSLRYENATVCSHIKSPPQVTAMDQTSGGVVFWATNTSNFYTAQIRPDGDYWIGRLINGNWINVIPRTKNESIKGGTNAVNEVAVTLVNNFGALFVNNVKVQNFRGQPPKGGGAIGLHAESEQAASDEWRFLDIAVMDNGKSKPVVLPPAPSGPTITDCRPANATDFQDTFKEADPGWGNTNDKVVQYVDGQLAVKPLENRYRLQLYRPLLFKNATVCATLKFPEQVTDLDRPSGGVAFWANDYQNYYVAAIHLNGTFVISRLINNKWATVVRSSPSDAIKKGLGAVNELQFVLNNANASAYVNGTKVSDFRGQPPADGGSVGLFATSEANQQNEWRFLNITVVENQ